MGIVRNHDEWNKFTKGKYSKLGKQSLVWDLICTCKHRLGNHGAMTGKCLKRINDRDKWPPKCDCKGYEDGFEAYGMEIRNGNKE